MSYAPPEAIHKMPGTLCVACLIVGSMGYAPPEAIAELFSLLKFKEELVYSRKFILKLLF
jgi:hypothetical protein